jgi:hypothetical protein
MKRNKRLSFDFKQSGVQISFSSEVLLQQAIAGLLSRMPDITDVQILQGPMETGKDIVFNIRGGFGEHIFCACVVKNTKITGSVNKTGGARTIYFQAEQALDTKYTNIDGSEAVVEKVYVVTPYDLPPSTIVSISGKLKEKAGRVKFISGSRLFDLFKKYWPEYLADEASLIEKHLKDIRDLLAEDDPLQSLAFEHSLGAVPSNLASVYVIQGFHRTIREYELGSVLTSSLSSPQIVYEKLDKDTILKLRKAFTKCDEALEYLNEWNLCHPTYDPNQLRESSHRFFEKLLSEWDRTVTRPPTESQQSIFFKRVYLPTPDSLKEQMHELFNQRRHCLSVLVEKLKQLKHIVSSPSFQGITALSDSDYLNASYLNECARLAPEGVFSYANRFIKVSFPQDILEQWGRDLLIVGAPGFGKTSFCRWNALLDAERFTLGESDFIPVYVPLKKFSRTEVTSFKETFLLGLGKSALITQPDASVRPRVRLYLDGLDEIPSVERRKAVVSVALNRTDEYPDSQVVITSRDFISATWLNAVPRVHLSEFSDSDVNDLIDKWLGVKTELTRRLHSQLRNLPTLQHLFRTPLLATLVIMVFKQTGRLPESKCRLYEVFIELLSGGWDMAKGILRCSKYGQKVKIIILSSLAVKLHTFRRREFGDDDIKAAIDSSLLGLKLTDYELLRDELIADGLIGQSGGTLYFSHLSFQEFLTARLLIGSPQQTRSEFALELYLCGDDWWKEVLKFYIGLSSNPNVATNWLVAQTGEARKNKPKKILLPQVLELVTSIVESFPDFPLDELAQRFGTINYEETLQFLKDFRRKILESE